MLKKLLTQYGGLKRELYILFVGKLVTAMGSFVYPMLTFFLTRKLGLSDGTATLLIATATTLSFPASLLGGRLADRFSRKNVIIVFDLLTVSFYFLSALLPIGIHTAVFVFLAGLFQTVETPAYDALNADFSTTSQRESAFSLSYLGYNLGYIVGASVAGILFENHTPLAFFINGLTILTSTVLIIFFVDMKNAVSAADETAEDGTAVSEYQLPVDAARPVFSVLRERRVVLWMVLIGCVASMPNILVGILLPLQLGRSLGESGSAVYGYLNSLNGFTVIALTPVLTLALRRFTEIPKTIAGLLFFIAGTVLFSTDSFVWVMFVGMFVYTIGEVVSVLGANPYSSRRIPESHRGRVGGLSNVVFSVFSSLTQYIISFVLILTESNYALIWWVFIGIGLCAAALYALMYRPDRKMFPKLYSDSDIL